MSSEQLTESLQTFDNRYQLVLAASRRSRQLLERAEKHGMSADTEKVIIQSLEEIVNGKVVYEVDMIEESSPAKKRAKEKEKEREKEKD